jgi:hypothetical protein
VSRIYFHSQDGTAELRGSERAHMGILCCDMFIASLGEIWDWKDNRSWTRELFPAGHYVLKAGREFNGPSYAQCCETYLRVGDAEILLGGKPVSGWTIGLNTALAMGNQVIKLFARLHGQCEIHCFVRGENRAWLSDIMAEGLLEGICRRDQGWEDVIQLLRSTDKLPVVCSYSVCRQFPNAAVALTLFAGFLDEAERDEDREAAFERFDELPASERWALAYVKLHPSLELQPDNWDAYRFGDLPNGFQLERLVRGTGERL